MSDKLQSEVEGKAIGAILYDAKNLDECLLAGVRPEEFVTFPFPAAYGAAVRLSEANEPLTVLNLVGRMALNGQASSVMQTLSELADKAGPYWLIKDLIRELRRASTARRVIAAGQLLSMTVQNSGHWTEREILEFAEKQLIGLRVEGPGVHIYSAEEMISDVMEQLDSYSQGVLPGLRTGLCKLDELTGGVKAGQLWIIAARPSMGKSSLVSQIADHNAVDHNIPVGVFSMEMGHIEWGHNMIHARARIDNRKAQKQTLDAIDHVTIGTSAGQIRKSPIEVCTQGELSINELRSIARQMKRRLGIKLFAVDYLQLASSRTKHGEGREREIAQVSNGLKAMAKELDAGVIVACQLNRQGEEPGKPRMSWIRESGQIEADADFIGVIYQPKVDDYRNLNLYILKQRSGTRFVDIPLYFHKEWTRFEQQPPTA